MISSKGRTIRKVMGGRGISKKQNFMQGRGTEKNRAKK